MHEVFVEPQAVGALGDNLALDFLVGDNPALLGVDQEHPAVLQAAFLGDLLRGHVEHAHL